MLLAAIALAAGALAGLMLGGKLSNSALRTRAETTCAAEGQRSRRQRGKPVDAAQVVSARALASFHAVVLLLAGALLELIGSDWATGRTGLALVVAGYLLLLGFAARNYRITGMVLIAAGLLANLVVVTWDGGMPVRGAAPGVSFGPRHHGETPADHLAGLADTVRLSFVGQTVSAGDIVLTVGTAVVAFGVVRPARRRRPAQEGAGAAPE